MDSEPLSAWQPVTRSNRYAALDVLRGLALLGVLIVNIETCFRVSFAEFLLGARDDSHWADHFAHVFIAVVLQNKSFSLFCLSFGIGMAVQMERAAPRGVGFRRFLARRFLVLLGLGLCHLFLIWNGDILVLYAVCGLVLVPLLRLHPLVLAIAGLAAIVLNAVFPWGPISLTVEYLQTLAERATRAYSEGGYVEIMAFRWQEAVDFMIPTLIVVLPKTLGLMLLGVAAWRSGLLREPQRHRLLLWIFLFGGGIIGGLATALVQFSPTLDPPTWFPSDELREISYFPLTLAYAAGAFLWLGSTRTVTIARPLAAVGQMALTNYLAQSVILGFIFYGYGFGLLGRLGPAAAASIGLALYAAQMIFSLAWLSRYQFGPVEWLWRSLTYGQWQKIRREEENLA